MIYKQSVEIPSYLCDMEDRLHTWAAIRLCQEVTEFHGNMTGIGFKTLLADNHAWVITRGLYHVFRMPDAFERVELSTWSRGNNGLIAMRDYRMLAPDGATLLTGTSYWALIDMSTRRVQRLGNVIKDYEDHDILATEYSELQKIKNPPQESLISTSYGEATFAMIDHTRHVNNSEYIKLVFDKLHEVGFDTTQPFTFEINYQLESRLGEQLTICHYLHDNFHYFKIDNPRGTSILARIGR